MTLVTVTVLSKDCPYKEVQIDLEENSTVAEIKSKLWPKTGIPAELQELLVSGLTSLYVCDRRKQEVAYAGSSNALPMVVQKAERMAKAQ